MAEIRTVRVTEPAVLIKINRTYPERSSGHELYDATRGLWRLNSRRARKAAIALAVYRGQVVEVYEIEQWLPAGTTKYLTRTFPASDLAKRWEFVGRVAPAAIRTKYIGHRPLGAARSQNPIQYLNM